VRLKTKTAKVSGAETDLRPPKKFLPFRAMNKMIPIIALLALTAIHSFSQENITLGVRAGFNLHNVFWNGKPPGIGLGYGEGIVVNIPKSPSLSLNSEINFFYRNLYNHEMSYGAKESITEFTIGVPIMVRYKPVPEVPFYTALGVQVIFPISSKLEQEFSEQEVQRGGVTIAIDGEKETRDYNDRSVVEFGVVLEFGYYITKNIAIDLRGSFNFADFSTDMSDIKPAVSIIPPTGAGEPPAGVSGPPAGVGGPPAGAAELPPVNPFKEDRAWLRPWLIQYGLGISYFF